MMVLGLYNDGVTVKDNTKSIAFLRFTDIVNALVTYVILPFYFLNGDAAFRKRVIQKGWLRALQTALLNNEDCCYRPNKAFVMKNNAMNES